jgi:hypothetical protein
MKAPEKIWGSRYDKQWSFADCGNAILALIPTAEGEA